jgi:YbbR domain-containing protein
MRLNLKLVSLILGSLLWIYVNLILSPHARRNFKGTIEIRNKASLTRVTLETEEVEITLDGTRRDFILAGPNAAQPWIDLLNIRPGRVQVPVRVNFPPGMSLVSVRPNQVVVQIEQLQEREFEIVPEVLGQTAEGYIAEPPVLNHRRVRVEAPPQVMDRITGAKVSILLQDVKNSVSENAKVVLTTANGEIREPITITPERVTVDILVKEGYPTRTVPVASPTFINKPPEGLRLDRFTVTPAEVTISGPPRVLKQVETITALPIDLSTLVASSEVVALLRPPQESIRILGTPTVLVQVALAVTPVTRPFPGLPLKVRNSPNQHCMVTPSSYTLVLKGLVKDLNRIRPADLALVLDVRDMKPGTYTVPLTCPPTLPQTIEALELLPAQVNVEISETEPTAPTASPSQAGSPGKP